MKQGKVEKRDTLRGSSQQARLKCLQKVEVLFSVFHDVFSLMAIKVYPLRELLVLKSHFVQPSSCSSRSGSIPHQGFPYCFREHDM